MNNQRDPNDKRDDEEENDQGSYDPAERYSAWEAIHNDPDYDPETDSEPGFPDYKE
jgi:hypothetical protein